MARLQVKICCMQSIAEARLALESGVDWLGFVSAMPSGPGPIPEDEIEVIVRLLPDPKQAVLLTSHSDPSEIIAQQRRIGAGMLQLCAPVSGGGLTELRGALPGVKLMPVVHVNSLAAVDQALELARDADILLLDSGFPNAEIPVLGGTGHVHDWEISRRIVERLEIPVFLAGGLTAGNVAGAIRMVRPAGIDVCTGVRSQGHLDAGRLSAFLDAIHSFQLPSA